MSRRAEECHFHPSCVLFSSASLSLFWASRTVCAQSRIHATKWLTTLQGSFFRFTSNFSIRREKKYKYIYTCNVFPYRHDNNKLGLCGINREEQSMKLLLPVIFVLPRYDDETAFDENIPYIHSYKDIENINTYIHIYRKK